MVVRPASLKTVCHSADHLGCGIVNRHLRAFLAYATIQNREPVSVQIQVSFRRD
jgi:hypothetical protein